MSHPQTADHFAAAQDFLSAQLTRNRLLFAVAATQPEQDEAEASSKSARAASFHRVPETCPALHAGGAGELMAFFDWLDSRFTERLTENEKTEIASRVAGHVSTLLEIAKNFGTRPLRSAHIQEIEKSKATTGGVAPA